jgi:hypothetical protein
MAPLLGLALGLAPELARYLFGRTGEVVATQATEMVRTITGTDDPDTAKAALQDTGKALELRVRLAEIAAAHEATRRQAELEETRAYLASQQGAREQTVSLARERSPMAWGAAVVTMLLSLLFAAAMLATWLGFPPLDAGMAETVKTLFIAACSYWIGSSRGSAVKDERSAAAPPKPTTTVNTSSGDVEVNADTMNQRELDRLRG